MPPASCLGSLRMGPWMVLSLQPNGQKDAKGSIRSMATWWKYSPVLNQWQLINFFVVHHQDHPRNEFVQLKLCCCKSQQSGSSMMTWAKPSVAPQREDVCVWSFLKTKQTIMLHDVQQLAVRIHHHFNSNSVIQFLHRTILAHPPAQQKTARRQILFSGFRLHPRSAWRRARGASDHLQVDKGRKCNPVAYRGAWNPYHHHLVGNRNKDQRDRDRDVSWKKLRLQVACRNQPKDQKIGGKNIRIGTGRHYTIPFFEIMEAF